MVHVNDNVPGAVYVGRAMPGRRGSVFGNPFRVGRRWLRGAAIALYREMVLANPMLLVRLPGLRSAEALACWCRHDGETEPACHADVLLDLLAKHTDDELREMAKAVRR